MLWVYLCWRGGDRGNLSVVLSVLMINWLPSSFFPVLQLAWQKTRKLAPTSNKKQWNVGSEWFKQQGQQSARLCYRLSGIVWKQKPSRVVVWEQVSAAYLLEFKQSIWTQDSTSSLMGPWPAVKSIVPLLPYPETVIPTELHSENENEFEGLSTTLILPNTTIPDRIQYRQANTT